MFDWIHCSCFFFFGWTVGGESQGGATEPSGPGRHLEVEEGVYMPEADRASLHDSEGLLKCTNH